MGEPFDEKDLDFNPKELKLTIYNTDAFHKIAQVSKVTQLVRCIEGLYYHIPIKMEIGSRSDLWTVLSRNEPDFLNKYGEFYELVENLV
jgi:hypothetical protein